ncbi:MAG: FAD-dependent oxidoreductase, partial [Pseudomonadota bacterium]
MSGTVPFPSDPDVVVVGAGAAGMAAARRLAEKGLSAVVVGPGAPADPARRL